MGTAPPATNGLRGRIVRLSLLIQEGARWTGTHLWSHKTEDWNGEIARALSQDRSIERVGANQGLLRNDGPKSQRLWESQRIC